MTHIAQKPISNNLILFQILYCIVVVQLFSHVWLCDPHGLQHARLPSSSSTPGACSNSRPLCQWCHPTVSSSVVPLSSCLQSYPASGYFLMTYSIITLLEEEMATHPVLLPGESLGQRSLVGYSSWGCRVGQDWATDTHMHTHNNYQMLSWMLLLWI